MFGFSKRFVAAAAMFASALSLSSQDVSATEFQIGVYGGANWTLDSDVTINQGTVQATDSVSWEGKPFAAPPYWGVRGTWWLDKRPNWGVAFDFVHAKAYSQDLDSLRYDVLEFTDGNNLFTVNAVYRYGTFQKWTPYAGVGVGVSVPHVEVSLDNDPTRTEEYQLTGIAAQVFGGVEYRFRPRWSAFAEGRFSYTNIHADLTGGGSLRTDLWHPHVSIGLNFHFGGPKQPVVDLK